MTTAREVCELLAIVPFEARSAVAARYEVPVWPPGSHSLRDLGGGEAPRRQRALAFLLAQKLARLADAGHGVGRGGAVWAVWPPAPGAVPAHGTVLGPDVCYAGGLAFGAVRRARERLEGLRPPGATWAVARAATLVLSLWRVLEASDDEAFRGQLTELVAAARLPPDALQLAADLGFRAELFPQLAVVAPGVRLEDSPCSVLGVPLRDVWSSAARPDGRREYVGAAEAEEALAAAAGGGAAAAVSVVRPLPELPASADGSFGGLLEAVHALWRAEAQRLLRGPEHLGSLLGAERAVAGVAAAATPAARAAALERALARARGSEALQREARALAGLLAASPARWPRGADDGPGPPRAACPHRVWRAMVAAAPPAR
jgi:hypothetical protein